jgi:hypothetical protein
MSGAGPDMSLVAGRVVFLAAKLVLHCRRADWWGKTPPCATNFSFCTNARPIVYRFVHVRLSHEFLLGYCIIFLLIN